jgi:hypothetical protein
MSFIGTAKYQGTPILFGNLLGITPRYYAFARGGEPPHLAKPDETKCLRGPEEVVD